MPWRRIFPLVVGLALLGWAGSAAPAPAQGQDEVTGIGSPGFWDPKRRPQRPDLTRLKIIRFITEVDYPPFNYAGPDGNPMGFNVDLARLICEEIKVTCTIQMRRYDTLVNALEARRGDAVIASLAVTPQSRAQLDFSDPYYRTPARFVARKDASILDTQPEKLEGKKVAVVAGSAHEAYLKALFAEVDVRTYATTEAARHALQSGEVNLLFGDAITLSVWLNGTESQNCCEFRGGAYLDSQYFGEGVAIGVKLGNETLRSALNWALFRIWEKGALTDLWLRYFPVTPF